MFGSLEARYGFHKALKRPIELCNSKYRSSDEAACKLARMQPPLLLTGLGRTLPKKYCICSREGSYVQVANLAGEMSFN